MKYVSYEEGCSRGYLILKLRKLIKEWKEGWDVTKTNLGWGNDFNEGIDYGKMRAADELEKLIFNLPPEL